MARAGLAPTLLAAALLAACAATDPEPSARVASASASTGQVAPASEGEPAAGEAAWERLVDAPIARLEMAVTAHDGRIWLAGGLSALGEALIDVEIFDPATGAWTDGPSLPAPLHHAALASDGERLILVGGYLGSDFNRPTDLVLVLPEDGDAWQEGPALPEARAAGAVAWDGERLVYAGGVGAAGVTGDVFTLAGDAWERLGVMSRSREHLAATSDGAGTVWLLGGRVGGLAGNLADVELVTGTSVTHIGSVPTARGGVAAFHDDTLGACLSGGEAPDRAFTTVECITADGTVTTLPELNDPHHGHGAAVVDGVAYVLLGGPQPTLSAGSSVESLALDR